MLEEVCHLSEYKRICTGVPELDGIGIFQGAVTEITLPETQGERTISSILLLYALLHTYVRGDRAALVDGCDCFQPRALPQGDVERLLWVRCRNAGEAMQAADYVARDGNFPLVVLLLMLNPDGELRRIPVAVWHRLQLLLEKSGAAMLVFTPFALVSNARLRIGTAGSFPLDMLQRRRLDLLAGVRVNVMRRRGKGGWDEALCRSSGA
ncbi:hypothetical protein DB346_21235 [Verrucomicrobia bacterium LW23]|nr:hypothetical protein DB346_21235 [Verrucomicrobia bacterium LW23]